MDDQELLECLHIEEVMEVLRLPERSWVEGMWIAKCRSCITVGKFNLVIQPAGRFVCLATGDHGDAIDLFAHCKSIDRREAVRQLKTI